MYRTISHRGGWWEELYGLIVMGGLESIEWYLTDQTHGNNVFDSIPYYNEPVLL
jgi:hypothetical protein